MILLKTHAKCFLTITYRMWLNVEEIWCFVNKHAFGYTIDSTNFNFVMYAWFSSYIEFIVNILFFFYLGFLDLLYFLVKGFILKNTYVLNYNFVSWRLPVLYMNKHVYDTLHCFMFLPLNVGLYEFVHGTSFSCFSSLSHMSMHSALRRNIFFAKDNCRQS